MTDIVLRVRVADREPYDLNASIVPAEDVPGQWAAFCPALDLVSQGDSFVHACAMIREACTIVITDDLARGSDPLDRGRAPLN